MIPMTSKNLFNEKYLEELFYEGQFPSIQELLDATQSLEKGNKAEIKALKEWRRKLYKKFHARQRRAETKQYRIGFNQMEYKAIELRAQLFDLPPLQYIKYAAKLFPMEYSLLLARKEIRACRALLLDFYNKTKNWSRNPDYTNQEEYEALAELILEMKTKFDAITGGNED